MNYVVAVNSYGRESAPIERAIRSFLNQQVLPGKIFFIDQNERPLQLSPDLESNPLVVHLNFPEKSCALARNSILNQIDSGWIAFCDDDGHAAPDYSEKLREILDRNPDAALIAGGILDETTGEFYSVRQKIGGRLDSFVGTKLMGGANFLIRAETFRSVSGYDPRLGPGSRWPSSEEPDLCWRVLLSGARVIFAPEIKVLHPPMFSSDATRAAQKAYHYGRGKGALAAKWIFERRHKFGFLEFAEMTVVPFLNMARGLVKGDFRQLRIQTAVLRGRLRGFLEFAFSGGRA